MAASITGADWACMLQHPGGDAYRPQLRSKLLYLFQSQRWAAAAAEGVRSNNWAAATALLAAADLRTLLQDTPPDKNVLCLLKVCIDFQAFPDEAAAAFAQVSWKRLHNQLLELLVFVTFAAVNE